MTYISQVSSFDILKKKLNAPACGVFSSSERLIECFTVLPVNMRFILEQMQLQGQHIRMEGSVGIFASWFRDAEPDVVTNAENIHFLWSCLDDTQRETVLDELHDVLLERHIRIDSRIAIITRFHNELSFIEPEKAVERRAIAALFSASVDNVLLSQWLDRQTFSFSSWWIGPYISRHFLSLNPLLVRRRRYSRGERYPSALCGCHSL
ncbi:hypothetical protein [Enterobacter kobei]|uniref:hypothetical protein n=1 Tax=Enterobacter kobei TaxID=208224 RepID=UPI00388E2312